jgi:anti-sigma B factor antagonist
VFEDGLSRPPRVVSVETFEVGGATVIVDGDLELETAPQLEAAITGLIGDGYQRLVIDLSAATFLDSVAMGTLMSSIEPLADDPDAAVVVAGSHGVVQRWLTITGIDRLFIRFATRGAAIYAVSEAADLVHDAWRHVHPTSYPSVDGPKR